jgi:ABC-type proline/glycine betaine transport system ATPase subunit
MYYDKILVLERGEIKEYDKPLTLVKDENTFLGRLIRKTGERYMQKIMALAEKSQSHKEE